MVFEQSQLWLPPNEWQLGKREAARGTLKIRVWVRARLASRSGVESRALGGRESEGIGQEVQGLQARDTSGTTFQCTNSLPAQVGLLSQRFLAQTGGQPVAPKQCPKGQCGQRTHCT